MFGLSWGQLWAIVSRADEMSALATDIAVVLQKHKPIIDHLISTLANEAVDPEIVEKKNKSKVIKTLNAHTTSNVDNN